VLDFVLERRVDKGLALFLFGVGFSTQVCELFTLLAWTI
jgi:hypothetical protein